MKNLQRTNNLTGKTFGGLTVIGLDDRGTHKTYWICQCECGNVKSVRSDSLISGAIRSCGCLKKEQDLINLDATERTKHRQSNTRLYTIWQALKGRCENPHNTRYHNYGGRGIKVCEEWKNSFENFYKWAVESGYSDELTIDRIDVDGDYCPSNCRWATRKEQSNNRTTNINITIGNSTKTLKEWCDIFEIEYRAAIARYHNNENITLDDLFNSKG